MLRCIIDAFAKEARFLCLAEERQFQHKYLKLAYA